MDATWLWAIPALPLGGATVNGTNIFLSEPNAAAMSDALLAACASSARAAMIGRAAKAFAAEHFGWDQFVEFVRTTYIRALRNVPPLLPLSA